MVTLCIKNKNKKTLLMRISQYRNRTFLLVYLPYGRQFDSGQQELSTLR
jgi:hypothetical protein